MSNQSPSPTSRRTVAKQHIVQRHLTGEITAAKRDEHLFRFDGKNRGARSRLVRRAKLDNKLYREGRIEVTEWRSRLADVRQQCAAAGFAAIPEAAGKEPEDEAPGGPSAGGLSAAKRAALDALHASRRGSRVHPLPARVSAALTLIRELLNEHNTQGTTIIPSARQFAAKIKVQPRTVGRWLDGELHPNPDHHPAILAWRDECKAAIPKTR